MVRAYTFSHGDLRYFRVLSTFANITLRLQNLETHRFVLSIRHQRLRSRPPYHDHGELFDGISPFFLRTRCCPYGIYDGWSTSGSHVFRDINEIGRFKLMFLLEGSVLGWRRVQGFWLKTCTLNENSFLDFLDSPLKRSPFVERTMGGTFDWTPVTRPASLPEPCSVVFCNDGFLCTTNPSRRYTKSPGGRLCCSARRGCPIRLGWCSRHVIR